jgi:hypothetical protein
MTPNDDARNDALNEAWKQASALEIALNRLVSSYPDPDRHERDAMQSLVNALAVLRKALEKRRHGL